MSYGKMSEFVPILLFGFNFDFKSHWNIWISLDKKIFGVTFEYIPWKNN